VYEPEGASAVLLYLHGGGFISGNLDTHDPLCRQLAAAAGVTVVAVDYRLAPENPYPAAIEDCRDVARWVAEEWRGTPISIAGDSAGGGLAAATALWARDEKAVTFASQVLIYPVLDATLSGASLVENGLVGPFTLLDCVFVWQQYLTGTGADPRDPFVSPLHASSLAGLPPTLMITSEFDILRSEGAAYAKRLEEAGVQVKHIDVPDMPHGFVQWGATVEEGREILERAAQFIARTAVVQPGALAAS
jgi:acetyl esterase